METFYALPTQTSMNPVHPEDADYFDEGQVAYILFKTSEARTRPTRIFTSFGELGVSIDDEVKLVHDQTGANLGTYRVAGIADYRNGYAVGLVPDIKIKHCVAK